MKHTRSGFSILEVLVAFVIMALVFAVLLPGQGDLLSRAQRSNDQLLATDIIRSLAAIERVPNIDASEETLALPPGWRINRTLVPNTFHSVTGITITLTIYGPYGRLLAERKMWRPTL
ncbi:hypothetical protein GCM10007385_10550 [Tateyamaria omphalii]|uniref:type II secretion system protein n=1 Tax=Tateyamaria omphalii TaxID=299262 RepID=UPI001676CAC3|nr:type II secretion system protein [Tateyamaria omphalii]GGX44495.1 hypothetical protein GCM10007385_10550 [Tateyamaria omphalii]